MKYPHLGVCVTPDEPLTVTYNPAREGSVSGLLIRQERGHIHLMGATPEQLLALAEGIRDAVHLVEIEQLGHDMAAVAS